MADHEAAKRLVGRREAETVIPYDTSKALLRRALLFRGLCLRQ